MGIADLPMLPFTGPFKGLLFVAECIAEAAERAFYDEEALRGDLLDLEILLQDGEIGEEEYARIEEQLMKRLAEARHRQEARGISKRLE